MLKQLFIKNFILIDALELNFDHGVIMITGETGAGKSIILGAIDMALGNQRGGAEKIKTGKTEAEIIVSFDVTRNNNAYHFLKENGLVDDDICMIRRLISLDGKNRYYINGRPSNLNLVRELSALLATLHTQHENQLLLNTKGQTMVIDAYAQTLDILEKISACVDAWKKNHAKRQERQQNGQGIPQRLDYLQYQQKELQSADLNLEEILSLPATHKALVAAIETLQYYNHALDAFSSHESTGILDALKHLQHTIAAIEKISGETELSTLLNEALVQLNELHRTIRYRSHQLHPDTEALERVEKRISVLHQLARKHQVTPEELPNVLHNIDQEIQSLTTNETTLLALNSERLIIESEYQQLTKELSEKRKKAATALATHVTQRIQQLGMSTAQFTIQFNKRSPEIISNDGAENPEFLLQANPGHPPALLKKSRFWR
ncbi:MAG: AAA family ATPase [Gammaproteobacteria bacterium]|nr:AAA family ATPase [Gammaproteobacteria bacterium]